MRSDYENVVRRDWYCDDIIWFNISGSNHYFKFINY